jgi:hypothetical protein
MGEERERQREPEEEARAKLEAEGAAVHSRGERQQEWTQTEGSVLCLSCRDGAVLLAEWGLATWSFIYFPTGTYPGGNSTGLLAQGDE